MKKLLIAGFVLGTLLGNAKAADLGVAKAPQVWPSYSWTGCYVGALGGAGMINDSYTSRIGGGGLAGGQIGCNYQFGTFLVGIEGEGIWSGVSNSNVISTAGVVTTASTRNSWDYDVALRVGAIESDRALLYIKLGGAYGGFNYSTTAPGFNQTGSVSLPGALIGTGAEYAFDAHWSGKVEYNLLNYLGRSASLSCTVGCAPSVNTESAIVHVFKLGIDYKFNQ